MVGQGAKEAARAPRSSGASPIVWAAGTLASAAVLGLVGWGIARANRSPVAHLPAPPRAGLAAQDEIPVPGRDVEPEERAEPRCGAAMAPAIEGEARPPLLVQVLEQEMQRRQHYFTKHIQARIGALERKKASFALRCIPSEFAQLHPDAVASMRANPEALLGEILPVPDAQSLAQIFPPIASGWLQKKYVEGLTEKISSFYSREQAALNGTQPPITILEFLVDERPRVSSLIRRSDDLWILVSEYGQNIVEGKSLAISGDEFRGRREDLEAELAEILWESSCRIENDLLEVVPQEVALWVRLSRVMTRYVYDDSYFISEAELDAAERSYPFHLR